MKFDHSLVKEAMERRRWTGADVSRRIGSGKQTVTQVMSLEREPRFGLGMQICRELNLDPFEVAGIKKPQQWNSDLDQEMVRCLEAFKDRIAREITERFSRPDWRAVMEAWRIHGGDVLQSSDLAPYFDVYEPPSTYGDLPVPVTMGEKSLSTQIFQYNDPARLYRDISGLEEHERLTISQSHLAARRGLPGVLPKHMKFAFVDDAVHYWMVSLPVNLQNGRAGTAVFCSIIG